MVFVNRILAIPFVLAAASQESAQLAAKSDKQKSCTMRKTEAPTIPMIIKIISISGVVSTKKETKMRTAIKSSFHAQNPLCRRARTERLSCTPRVTKNITAWKIESEMKMRYAPETASKSEQNISSEEVSKIISEKLAQLDSKSKYDSRILNSRINLT